MSWRFGLLAPMLMIGTPLLETENPGRDARLLPSGPTSSTLFANAVDPELTAHNVLPLSHMLTVSVTVDSVSNLRSGDVFHCVDPAGPFCGRADWFAVMSFTDKNGTVSKCSNTPWVADTDFLRPGWNCLVNGTPMTGPWEAPVTFSIDIYDYDGTGLANIDGADHADITPGPGNTFTTPVAVGTTSLVTASSDVRVGVTITASMVPARFNSLSAFPLMFDPRLGEVTTLSWSISEPAVLTMTVSRTIGGQTVRTESVPFVTPALAQYPWDGKDDAGNQVPTGSYKITITAAPTATGQVSPVPGSMDVGVNVIMRPTNSLTLQAVSPPSGSSWNPGSGAVVLRFSLSSDADAGLRVFSGQMCSGAPMGAVAARRFALGTSTIQWDGKDSQGSYATPGTYAIELSARSPAGASTNPPTFCVKMNLVPAPALELMATHDPVIANAGGIVTFTLEAVDAAHAPRRTGKLEIWVADANSFRSRVPPVVPRDTCDSRSSCSFTVINPAADTGLPSRFAYKAIAYDLDNGARAETPWRAVDVLDLSTTYGLNTPTIPRAAGVVSDPFGVIDSHHTQDLVFYPGSGHDVTTSSGRAFFSATVRAHVRQIWGLGPAVFPSSVASRQDAISFYVVQRMVPVTESAPDRPFAENLCSIGAIQRPSFAEANAVLHQQPCRDNAPGGMYTANSPTVTWHEMHHAMFGLADEYFILGTGGAPNIEGGYWQADPNPNLYFWPADCANDPLAGGRPCTALRPAGSPLPGQSTRWWRFDLTPDVMINNTFEQPGDTRRAIWLLDRCRAALC